MNKRIFVILFSFFVVLGMNAESLINASTGFHLSLTKDGKTISSVDRGERIYLCGPFSNQSGKTLQVNFGIEFKDTITGEKFFKKLCSDDSWVGNYQLVYVSLYTDFMINNSVYEVRPIYIEQGKDASVLDNWEYVGLPSNFDIPTLQITGNILSAYFSKSPFIGTEKNIAEFNDTQMRISITSQQDLNNAELFAFVFKEGGELSIGYYKFVLNQSNGQSKDYIVSYQQNGSKSAPLEIGQTYELSFRFFVNKKEQVFDSRYDSMTFEVVANGSGLDLIQESESITNSSRKIMKDNGQIEINVGGKTYSIFGTLK